MAKRLKWKDIPTRKVVKRAGVTPSDKRSIAVDPTTLNVVVTEEPSANLVPFPLAWDGWWDVPEVRTLGWDILMDDTAALLEARSATAAFRFEVPDPWLSAVIYIMWQGLLQGLTWDATKLIVRSALRLMRREGVAPAARGRSKPKVGRTTVELGFTYEYVAQDQEEQKRLFFGLRREYRRMSPRQRKAVLRVRKHPVPTRKARRAKK